jgi:thiol-disulfide isomerase/thioredoxin
MSPLTMALLQSWKSLRKRSGFALVFDVGLIILVFLLIHGWNTRQLPKGNEVPTLVLAQLDSPLIERELPSDGVGVVYFFAPWCFYCKNSIDNLDQLVANGDIAWARAVALDFEGLDEVREFVTETGLQQPVLLGTRQTIQDWNINAFPTYFVLDGEGNITSRSVGYSTSLGLWARSKLAQH